MDSQNASILGSAAQTPPADASGDVDLVVECFGGDDVFRRQITGAKEILQTDRHVGQHVGFFYKPVPQIKAAIKGAIRARASFLVDTRIAEGAR